MLGPLSIVSLDQGKLYGNAATPEQVLWWTSAARNTDLEAAELTEMPTHTVERLKFLAAIDALLKRTTRIRHNSIHIPERSLTRR
ncbi:hypothetical protein OIU34_16430 [Pararhizobium sp. BT-229]|uniref:hypothetical protein n=1 Tax=Pararhizobium sp. BT-229 TaxID=2986923 RepID=UPI0021F7BE3C|nr:hypothetical protein [Pararhizobium sp. BT-229]MCV9963492.1 hypothetical protein [Pararhizobium sp. BT-229]